MSEKMKRLIRNWYHSQVLRYIFSGGLTTLVNLGTFYIARRLFRVPLTAANILSVSAAILFAYAINTVFVFRSKRSGPVERLWEFVRFVGGRLVTMVMEVGGVWLMVEILHMNDMAAKLLTQFVVLVLNYIISKFLVFGEGKAR